MYRFYVLPFCAEKIFVFMAVVPQFFIMSLSMFCCCCCCWREICTKCEQKEQALQQNIQRWIVEEVLWNCYSVNVVTFTCTNLPFFNDLIFFALKLLQIIQLIHTSWICATFKIKFLLMMQGKIFISIYTYFMLTLFICTSRSGKQGIPTFPWPLQFNRLKNRKK